MKNKIIAALIAFMATAGAAFAQNGVITPYSRYGYGILRDNATAAQQSMGGIGYAMGSGQQTNVMNPASYARIDSLTFLFDMGLDFTSLWSTETDPDGTTLSENDFGGGLNYITMQFPIGKRLGMSVGILPYSSVGYSFGNSIDNGYASRQGTGSINKLYVGLGARIIDGLNAGVNVSYLFGSTVNDTYAITSSGSQSLYEDELTVRDWHIDAGLLYTLPIGRDALTIGLTYSPAKSILGHIRTYAYDVDEDKNASEHSRIKTKGLYSMAASYGAGINYMHNSRLMLEADFTYQPWSKEKYNGATNALADRYKIAAGGYFQPAKRGAYFKCIQYRLGASYNRDYIVVRQNNVREYTASIGFGLPVPGFKTIVNLGIEWKHRQAYPNALLKENYLNITLGLNFNEMWFRKSRIY